jgi:hypothetical protein
MLFAVNFAIIFYKLWPMKCAQIWVINKFSSLWQSVLKFLQWCTSLETTSILIANKDFGDIKVIIRIEK